MADKNCCHAWRDAQAPGTDNESYGAALLFWDGEWQISGNLPGVNFCPWCGAAKEDGSDNKEEA